MSGRRRILFVSHAASRNGATILLLNLLQWLGERTDYQIDILMNGSGELLDDFRAIGRTIVWRNPDRLFGCFPGPSRAPLASCLRKLQMLGQSYDLVYLNTSTVLQYLPLFGTLTRCILLHVHELEYALQNTMEETRIRQLLPKATRIVAVSTPVRELLLQKYQIPSERVDLVHGFVPIPRECRDEAEVRRRQIRETLAWPQTAFVVGACGALGWRKGTDLFLQVAKQVSSFANQDHIRFLWVGGGSKDEILRFQHDAEAVGLGKQCHAIPTTPDADQYYYAMDAFVLTSREDPFPLVMLEAATRHLPIVCFAGSGGGPEFVGTDAGFTVPYLDTAEYARHVQILVDSPSLCRKLGTAAAEKVRSHYIIDSQGPKLLESIERCLSATV